MRAEVDEVWAIEKCSVAGARPVHLVVQLLYGLLWEDCMAPFTHEKKQKTESCCCDLKRGAVWQSDCHLNLAGLKAESSERGAAKSEREWVFIVLFFTDTQDSQLSVLVRQTTVFSLQTPINSWWEFSNKMNINAYSCFGSAWQLYVFWFLVRLPLHRLPFPLAETGAQGVIGKLSGPLVTFHCLTQDLAIAQDLQALCFAIQFSTNVQ